MEITLVRTAQTSYYTTGKITIQDPSTRIEKTFATLERGWLNNKMLVSCIPTGTFFIKKEVHPKFNKCFRLIGVPRRSGILMHVGNYVHDSHGCILIAEKFGANEKNGIPTILNSRIAMDTFYDLVDDNSTLIIKNQND